jgi:non-specific serine/threonine protein kinase/serine/threonine-protein kinase
MTMRDGPNDRWLRASSLCDEAVKLPAADRQAFLLAACAGDTDLLGQVTSLLDAADRSTDFLERPLLPRAGVLFQKPMDDQSSGIAGRPIGAPDEDSTLTAAASGERAGDIGPYRLLEKIGEGGMGEVWLASQTEPIKRRVALKLIKAGMDTRQVIARFEAERQALALMDHPAIARVYEAGETPRGLPFFAMEHIAGEPITSYADRQRLTTAERITLFRRVCDGVQHAHQKGIIHRDLKPSNVLVTIVGNQPEPKIIDFGVAKATAQRLTEKTMFTEMGVLVGTPEYMSPEQAEMTGLDIDTRTDVYALGVILYELLTGTLPFEPKELRQAGYDEIRRRIREVEPPRPSTRVRTLGARSEEAARNRRTEPGRLASGLKGDLDWIVMKALEKDRTRRYGSPSDLAADLARHLGHEPVLAGPPSAWYRAGKFVRRHRFGVAAAALSVAALVAFGVATAMQTRAIARERDRAERVSSFLVSLFQSSDPAISRGKEITAREIFDRGVKRIDEELKDDPQLQARLLMTVGNVYVRLGLWKQGESLLRKAIASYEHTVGPEAIEMFDARICLSSALEGQHRYKEAEAIDAATLDTWRRRHGEEDQRTLTALHRLGVDYEKQGRLDEAEQTDRKVLDARRRTVGESAMTTLWSMQNLAAVLQLRGRNAEAESYFRQAYEGMKRTAGADHPDTLWIGHNLAGVFWEQKRYGDAEALYREILETRKRVLGPEHPSTQATLSNLSNVLLDDGRIGEAEESLRALLEGSRTVRGTDDPFTLNVLGSLAFALLEEKRYDEGERMLLEAQEGFLRVSGPTNPDTLDSYYNLACFESRRGRLKEAIEWLQKAVDGGFSKAEVMKEDADLVPLRRDPAFKRLLVDARANGSRPQH